MKLANKIALSFFVAAFLLIAGAETFFYSFSRDSLRTALVNNLRTAVTSRASHVDTYLDTLKILAVARSRNVVFENFLSARQQTALAASEALAQAAEELKRAVGASPVFQECFLLEAAGKVAVSSRDKAVGEDRSLDPSFINGQHGVYLRDVYRLPGQSPAVMEVSAPVTSSATGTVLGVFVARISLGELDVIADERTGLGKSGDIFIVNRNDELITSSAFGEHSLLTVVDDLAAAREKDVFVDFRGVPVLGAHAGIAQMGWTVFARINADEAFAPLALLFKIFLFILILVPLAAGMVGWKVAELITAPLHRLREGMEIIGKGDLEHRVGMASKDEVGQLSRAFDVMSSNLRKTTLFAEELNKEINERKKIEFALLESEQRFMDVLYFSKDAILIINGDQFVDCNDMAVAMLGYASREDLLKTHPSKLSPDFQPDGQLSFDKANEMMRLAKERGAHSFEWIHRKANGKDFPVKVTLTSMAIRGKNVLHCVWLDLSALKDKEALLAEHQAKISRQTLELDAALAESRRSQAILLSMLEDNNLMREQFELSTRKFKLILESTGEGVLGLDLEGRHTFINRAALTMLGFQEQELIGQASHSLWHHSRSDGSVYPDSECPIFTCLHRSVVVTGEEYFYCKDGSGFPVEFSARPMIENRKAVGAVITFRDITERKAAENRIRTLSRAIEQNPSAVVITNIEGNIEYVNQKFVEMTGYTPEEVLGKNPRVLKSGEIPPEGYEEMWTTLAAGRVWRGEFHNRKKNGELYWEEATIMPVRDPAGKTLQYIAIKDDVTEHKAAEESMREMRKSLDESQAQLFQTSKLATLGEMATGLAHEINQPLGGIALVITMFRKYIEKKILNEDKVTAGIKDIDQCVKRMTKIITHIRAFARQEEFKAQDVYVEETVDSALGLLGAQLREHEVEVEKIVEPGMPTIKGEPFQLEQVWINAISNARDSMNEKQKLAGPTDDPALKYHKKLLVTLAHDKAANKVILTFTDNGMGVKDEIKKKVFDPFFTTKEVGKGTGLGLSISYGIVESHKGTITIDGKEGIGATLRVTLPVDLTAVKA
ncbi:MAG: PAS domain S-box protein [Candidatus Omnitrophica bacterium]|nr:PAS domain S-box protein [Candidatus Omnitrophota bacterium]